jgi:hypothetical protein
MKKEAEQLSVLESSKNAEDANFKRDNSILKYKILVDKVGAGFSSIQFLNILFSFTGASMFMIGIVNAFRSAINMMVSSFVKRRAEKSSFSTDLMIVSGIFFGFSFLFIALGISLKWKWLFALSLLLGSVFFVIHGDMFQIFLNRYMKRLKSGIFTERTTFTGIIVMAVALFLSSWLMENISFAGEYFTFPLIGKNIYFGYLISFEIAAFAFIFSSYLFMRIKVNINSFSEKDNIPAESYFSQLRSSFQKYFKNKYLFTLTLATIFVGVFQAIMNSFVGIYVYKEFSDAFLGGFLNVGFMLALALLVVLIGPTITGKMNRNLGVAPLFVFGTLLMAILPLTLYYNSYFPAIVVANMLSVLGAAMIGSGHNLVSVRLLNEKDREAYYTFSGIITLIPFVVLVALLSLFANNAGLLALFRFMGIGVVVCLFPIYLLMVIWISNRH